MVGRNRKATRANQKETPPVHDFEALDLGSTLLIGPAINLYTSSFALVIFRVISSVTAYLKEFATTKNRTTNIRVCSMHLDFICLLVPSCYTFDISKAWSTSFYLVYISMSKVTVTTAASENMH